MHAATAAVPASHPLLALGADLPVARSLSANRCSSTYWPAETLNVFMLRMAAAGHCVNAAMMLGDRDYALRQLTVALALQDHALRDLAGELHAYFKF